MRTAKVAVDWTDVWFDVAKQARDVAFEFVRPETVEIPSQPSSWRARASIETKGLPDV